MISSARRRAAAEAGTPGRGNRGLPLPAGAQPRELVLLSRLGKGSKTKYVGSCLEIGRSRLQALSAEDDSLLPLQAARRRSVRSTRKPGKSFRRDWYLADFPSTSC